MIAAETLVMYPLKQVAPVNNLLVVYLLGVIVVASIWGLWLTVATAAASVLAFDFFHTPPLYTITLNTPEDHTAVSAFLVVGLMTSTLAGLARSRAALAEQRNQLAEAAAERARVLAEQQAALRRVATLVARGSSPSEVFAAVADEMVRCVNCGNASVSRLDGDRVTFVAFAGLDPERTPLPVVGECLSLDDDVIVAEVLRTGRPVRMDCYEKATGAVAARIRERGLNSVVATPIIVDSRIWGLAGVASVEPLPPETEERISDFADLVATALANAATRDELIASRARIVAAADDARRRLERDLHDGAQQRLVSLGLQLRLAESSVPPELQSLKEQMSGIVSGLTAVSSDLQEISRGIHPAILSDGGLGPALRTLARRCPIPAIVDVLIEGRLPDSVEVAAYYVAAEALTNAAKYADASHVSVCMEIKEGNLCLSIQDDGIGGADSRKGSGLIGLKDRVEVLGGHMKVISPMGSGTSLHVTIPLPTE
jgi:signal transduction histidine kinase